MVPTVQGWRSLLGIVAKKLDWSRIGEIRDDDGVVRANEQRLARMVVFIRVATVPFLAVPLATWPQLPRPWLVVVSIFGAAAESWWFARRACRPQGLRRDVVLAWSDVAFCVALMVVGSRAGAPTQRNALLTEVVPFSLVSSVVLAFVIGLRRTAIAGVVLLGLTWSWAIWPNVTQKLGSDLLGFVIWYLAGLGVATLLRRMAADTAAAVVEQRAAQSYAAEQHRLLELALYRETLRSGLHDGVLPIFDGLSMDTRLTPEARRVARQGSLRARALLTEVRGRDAGLESMILDLAQEFLDLGLSLTPRLYVHSEPPPDVADIFVASAREALANALKYAGHGTEVVLFVESDAEGLEISVMDGGPGFEPTTVARGGGYGESLPQVEAVGGSLSVVSAPGHGAKIVLSWRRPTGLDQA